MGKRLIIMTLASFVVMYVLMYMMVDVFGNALPNINQLYMAAVMTAAMVIIEVLIMGAMYKNKASIIVGSVLVGGLCFFLLRHQTGVSDKQFLKSMIPHHGAALLMCKQATLNDPEIKRLCDGIIAGQQSEIDWMQAKLQNF